MSDPFLSLPDLETHIWDRLARGAATSRDPFRFVTLATQGTDGPEARMVGFRRADRVAAEIEIHSDLRTAKVRALDVDDRATILLWDPATEVQIRLMVTLRLVSSEAGRWARIPDVARLNYGTNPAPGTPVEAPERVTRTPDISRFCALVGAVRSMDVLSLAHTPHRRARFVGGHGEWIAP